MTVAPRAHNRTTPTPDPSPQGGGARTEQAARLDSRRNSAGVQLGGVLHRLDDFDVAGAAADVAAERGANVVLTRTRIAAQQARRRHDESGRAVAALGAELLVEPALHRRKPAVLAERFDGVDALTVHGRREREARQSRLVVDEHGAGAALAAVTTSFCSSESDDFPQIVQQQQIIGHRVDAAAAVENKLENAGHACRSNTTFGTPFK